MPAANDTLRRAAQRLVRYHRKAEPNLARVWFYPDPGRRELRLLEVVTDSPSAGQAYPFRFAADPDNGVPYPSVLIELSPAEFAMVQRGELRLPPGWGAHEELFPR